jgi:hypothetical protein
MEAQILDFLKLMQQAYAQEMFDREQNETIPEEGTICPHCQSQICFMVQSANKPLQCWTIYCKNVEELNKLYFSAKVIPELLEKSQ